MLFDSAAYPQNLPPSMNLLAIPSLVYLMPPEAIAKGLILSTHADWAAIEREDIYSYAHPLYEIGGKQALTQTVQHLQQPKSFDVGKRYESIWQPTLLLWCNADHVVPTSVGRRLNDDIPNTQLEFITGCAHVPHVEQAARTAKILLRFLRK